MGRWAANRTAWLCMASIWLGTVGVLGLRFAIPINPGDLDATAYDYGLFERLGASVANHDWLGPLTPLTLSKGPALPMFIALTHRLHVPLQVGFQLTYVLAAAALALCVALVWRSWLAATAVYLLVVFDPAHLTAMSAEVYRDEWYAALALLFFSATFLTILLAVSRRTVWMVATSATISGLSGATYWMCREEGMWIAPALALTSVALVVGARHRKTAGPLTLAAVIAAVAFWGPVELVKRRNDQIYGAHLVTDLAAGAFPDAYAAWSRVRGVPLKPKVPIDAAQRRAVYAVSPTARVLEPFLEDPGNGWAMWGCDRLRVCGDFAGGAAPWALRAAAAQSGHFDNEREFQRFFTRLAREVNSACDEGRLRCARRLPPSLQAADRASVGGVVSSATRWFSRLPYEAMFRDVFGARDLHRVTVANRRAIGKVIAGVAATDADAGREARRFYANALPYRVLMDGYVAAFYAMGAASLCGLVVSIRRRRRPRGPLLVLLASLALGVGVRLVFVAIIDTTQYFAEPRYYLPARTFLVAIVAIGAVGLARAVKRGDLHASLGELG